MAPPQAPIIAVYLPKCGRRGQTELMRVVVTRISQDGAMRRRMVDTAVSGDVGPWEELAARALAAPPPYCPVPGGRSTIFASMTRLSWSPSTSCPGRCMTWSPPCSPSVRRHIEPMTSRSARALLAASRSTGRTRVVLAARTASIWSATALSAAVSRSVQNGMLCVLSGWDRAAGAGQDASPVG
jgi:hypothetical protein